MKKALFLALFSVLTLTHKNHALAFGKKPSAQVPAAPAPQPAPVPVQTPPANTTSGVYTQKIEDLASGSACISYNWKGRGRAPAGYVKGLALSFARSLCRYKNDIQISSPAQVMSEANTGNSSKDALAYYESSFSNLSMEIDQSSEDTIRSLYTLGMGLGMRESSGNYSEGWDTTAGSNRPSSEAEAGLFQTSYDSMAASVELSKLYTDYQAHPSRCLLNVFQEGASNQHSSNLGTGAGASFQSFIKSCPAFATEYAMVVLRVLRGHFGPIVRKEAEVVSSCNVMLSDVQRFVEQDPTNTCADLN